MNIVNKVALFKDYNGDIHRADIKIIAEKYIGITTYLDNEPSGYMNIHFHPNNRLYLDTIYCYSKYRRLGVASMISKIADYILKDYNSFIIRGTYYPCQLSTDTKNKVQPSIEELDVAARSFYKKANYLVISFEEFVKDKVNYPFLANEDFCLSEEGLTTIVAKEIKPEVPFFYEDNGLILENGIKQLKRIK